jgi:hypothetical protein
MTCKFCAANAKVTAAKLADGHFSPSHKAALLDLLALVGPIGSPAPKCSCPITPMVSFG